MKHIIFVENMKCEGCAKRISEELDNTRVEYTISLINKSVTVEGSNDTVHTAKQAIQAAGYYVK